MKKKVEVLGLICSFLQITGLVLMVSAKQLPVFTPVLIGITGFAGVARFFLPGSTSKIHNFLRPIAAVAGVGIIIFACVMV